MFSTDSQSPREDPGFLFATQVLSTARTSTLTSLTFHLRHEALSSSVYCDTNSALFAKIDMETERFPLLKEVRFEVNVDLDERTESSRMNESSLESFKTLLMEGFPSTLQRGLFQFCTSS